jgi:hypothetical protein
MTTTYLKDTQLYYIGDVPIDDSSLIKSHLTTDGVFIDIGCKSGYHALLLSKHCQKVIAYDTNMTSLSHLKLGIELNNLTNLEIITNLDIDIQNVQLIKMSVSNKIPILNHLIARIQAWKYPPILLYISPPEHIILPVFGLFGYQSTKIREDVYLLKHPNYKPINLHLVDLDLELLSHASRDHVSQLLNAMKPLPIKKSYLLNIPMRADKVPNNPAIIKIQDGYLCNLRCSNYDYEPHFRFLDGGNVHRSDHALLWMNEDFMIKTSTWVKEPRFQPYHPSFVEGIDDLRLIDESKFICSHGNFNPHRLVQQCYGEFDEMGVVTKLIPLKGPNPNRHEKNWLAFNYNNKIAVIYFIHPFTLFEINTDTGELIKLKEIRLSDLHLEDFRGSAPPIVYKNGWLCTAHQVFQMRYVHRFVWFDEKFEKMRYSVPFYFDTVGVEFNVGMCLSPDGDIVLTHSIRDNHSRISLVGSNVVDELLDF